MIFQNDLAARNENLAMMLNTFVLQDGKNAVFWNFFRFFSISSTLLTPLKFTVDYNAIVAKEPYHLVWENLPIESWYEPYDIFMTNMSDLYQVAINFEVIKKEPKCYQNVNSKCYQKHR